MHNPYFLWINLVICHLLGQKNQCDCVVYMEIKFCPFFRHTSATTTRVKRKLRLVSAPRISSFQPLSLEESCTLQDGKEFHSKMKMASHFKDKFKLYRVHIINQLIQISASSAEDHYCSWYPELREW